MIRFQRESSSRPESRGAATNSPMTMHSYMNHTHGQAAALQMLQQQQAQSPQTGPTGPGMVSATHPTNQAAYFPQYFPASFANMPQFINATAQQMGLGMMPTSMLPTQGLIPNQVPTPNTNNGSSSGMTTPNSSVSGGPTYKLNTNSSQANESGNMAPNNNMTKKSKIIKKYEILSLLFRNAHLSFHYQPLFQYKILGNQICHRNNSKHKDHRRSFIQILQCVFFLQNI